MQVKWGTNCSSHFTVTIHLGVYAFLFGMSVTSLCSPLGLNPAWQWSLKTSLVFLRISPLDWTYFWLNTATCQILTNGKLPPELSLPAECFIELRNSRAVKRKHDDFNSALANWVCIYLPSIFTVRNALRYKKIESYLYSQLLE